MSKITQYISSIGTDKCMHFLVCEVLAWLIARVLRLCGTAESGVDGEAQPLDFCKRYRVSTFLT